MKISQPTISRILNAARKKVADALVNGKCIKIEGGDFKFVDATEKVRENAASTASNTA